MSKRKVIKALNGSIRKWENIAFCGAYDKGQRDCPLCKIFDNNADYPCEGCPVSEKTGKCYCSGSPYTEWSHYLSDKPFVFDKKSQTLALRELRFLCRLRNEYEQKIAGNWKF